LDETLLGRAGYTIRFATHLYLISSHLTSEWRVRCGRS